MTALSLPGGAALPGAVRRPRRDGALAALPSGLWYAAFFLLPLAAIVLYSFGAKPVGPGIVDLASPSTANYAAVLDDTFTSTFRQTVQTSALSTLLLLVVAFPVAYTVATRVSPAWRPLLLGLVIVPFWTSFLLRTFAWRIILSPLGPLSEGLVGIGVLDAPLAVLDTRGAVQLGLLYNYLPLMIFPLFVALDRIDPALREAGKDLGAGRVRTFLTVTAPLALPGVVAGVLLVFIPLMGEYVTPTVLGGAKGLMVGNLVASQFLEAQNVPLGSAMAVVLVGLTLAVIGVVASVCLLARTLVRRARSVELPA